MVRFSILLEVNVPTYLFVTYAGKINSGLTLFLRLKCYIDIYNLIKAVMA